METATGNERQVQLAFGLSSMTGLRLGDMQHLRWSDIKDKAGIEKDFTYHSSRHTTATLAITAGADISAVKEMLGHGSVTSTEVYAKVGLDKKIQAVSLTDGVFG
ncbi:tyrosine-type recombinase/integrase [Prevotella sp. P5-92]|uniref:tyrosine-type recombinase/integrase n=1 Tax=Prevotella sp. P5-92 TaxID=2024222 RepID=UPI0020B10C53|nr:tyrosine-type recombinase/integrase [Prevotella sp. P5-92]